MRTHHFFNGAAARDAVSGCWQNSHRRWGGGSKFVRYGIPSALRIPFWLVQSLNGAHALPLGKVARAQPVTTFNSPCSLPLPPPPPASPLWAFHFSRPCATPSACSSWPARAPCPSAPLSHRTSSPLVCPCVRAFPRAHLQDGLVRRALAKAVGGDHRTRASMPKARLRIKSIFWRIRDSGGCQWSSGPDDATPRMAGGSFHCSLCLLAPQDCTAHAWFQLLMMMSVSG